MVHEVTDSQERHRCIVNDYMGLLHSRESEDADTEWDERRATRADGRPTSRRYRLRVV